MSEIEDYFSKSKKKEQVFLIIVCIVFFSVCYLLYYTHYEVYKMHHNESNVEHLPLKIIINHK